MDDVGENILMDQRLHWHRLQHFQCRRGLSNLYHHQRISARVEHPGFHCPKRHRSHWPARGSDADSISAAPAYASLNGDGACPGGGRQSLHRHGHRPKSGQQHRYRLYRHRPFYQQRQSGLLPPNPTLTNGVGTFVVTLKTAGGQTLTVTDTANAGITGDIRAAPLRLMPPRRPILG